MNGNAVGRVLGSLAAIVLALGGNSQTVTVDAESAGRQDTISVVQDPSVSPLVNGNGVTLDANGLMYHVLPDDDNLVTFTFAGDVLLDPSYAAGVAIRQRGMTGCFDEGLLGIMQGSDVFMLNNEFPYTNNPVCNSKKYTFRADPADAVKLLEIGTDLVSLSNNHVFDRCEKGFLDTLTTLRQNGIPYVGAGENIEEASRPYLYETTNGMKIAVLNSTCIERYPAASTRGASATQSGVFRSYDPTLLYQKIAEAKTYADYVIVYVHWGTEKEARPDANQKQMAKGMAEAGANLIIGDHPHCLQTIDFVQGVPVIYSLGNYIFNNHTRQTALVRLMLQPTTKQAIGLELIPVSCDSACKQTLATGAARTAILQYERSLSPNVVIQDDGLILPVQ